jgi:hypothetical protein
MNCVDPAQAGAAAKANVMTTAPASDPSARAPRM